MMRTELHILVSLVLSEDIQLGTAEMNRRGIPTNIRPNRSPAILAKMLTNNVFTMGPLEGFVVRGSNKAGGYHLVSPKGKVVADIKANGVFEVQWKPDADQHLTSLKTYCANWLHAQIADLRDVLNREAVRRMFLAWLESIGFEATGIPSLYMGDLDKREELERVIDALPEAEWTTWQAQEFG